MGPHMRIGKAIGTIALLVGASACNQPSSSVPSIIKDADYFTTHLDEARDVALACRTTRYAEGSAEAQRCEAADHGLRKAIGAKTQKENFGDAKSLPNFGNGY